MTTAPIITRGYEEAIANLPDEAILGSLLWFTISNADVNMATARADLVARGLDDTLLREGNRPVDAFRKASNEFAHKFPVRGQQRTELLVRQVGQDSEQSHRHIILERAEFATGKKRRVGYDTVAEIVFTRGTKAKGVYSGYKIQARRTGLLVSMSDDEEAWLKHHLDCLEERFEHQLSHMDSHAVRSFVRGYIAKMNGILAKESGGLYFVMQGHAAEVKQLGEWVESIGSSFHSLPLLNLADQRAMILQALEDETVKEVERLMEDVAAILKDPDRTITDSTYDGFTQSAVDLQVRLSDYTQMLGERSDRALQDVAMFSQQLTALASRIKKPAKLRGKAS